MNEENKMIKELGHVDTIKDKLQTVTSEIDVLKNSFTKGAEDLARIQSMLDVGGLEEITTIIDRYEGQIAEAERQKAEAAEGAKKYSEELEKEKERLIKLWDAYKNQEEELSTTEKKIADYEEQARNAVAEKQQIEEDYTARVNLLTQRLEENEDKIQKFDDYKSRVEEFDNVRNRLEGENHELREEINNRDSTINSLQQQIEELKQYEAQSEYKEKYEQLNQEYEKEKERLTKLYQLYEETDNECKQLKQDNNNWQKWFNSNREIFEKLFSAAPTTIGQEPPNSPPRAPNPPSNPQNTKNNTTTTKKKRKIRFKKQ